MGEKSANRRARVAPTTRNMIWETVVLLIMKKRMIMQTPQPPTGILHVITLRVIKQKRTGEEEPVNIEIQESAKCFSNTFCLNVEQKCDETPRFKRGAELTVQKCDMERNTNVTVPARSLHPWGSANNSCYPGEPW